MERKIAEMMPPEAAEILHTLEQAGYEAYIVGGCVRDAILGRLPNDWDITTSATPMQVKALFPRTVDTGIAHGTVTVLLHHTGYEVTTYRVDGTYLDGRHPSGVTFTRSLQEDLCRRDFTVNAMAYHPQKGLVDLFGGCEDLQRGVIRCVGVPKERFGEDALRILRGVRFAAQLGYCIDADTAEAMKALRENLRLISQERIQVELVKLLQSDHPEYFLQLYEYGITAVIMPEFDMCMKTEQHTPYHAFDVGHHTLRVVQGVRPGRILRLAALFHDFGKPETLTVDANVTHFYGHPQESARIAKKILQRLKFDNDTIRRVSHLVEFHNYPLQNPTRKSIRRAVHKIGTEDFVNLLELKRADALGKHEAPGEIEERTLENLQKAEQLYQEIMEAQECVGLKQLAINGGDLIAGGCPAGPMVGACLNWLLEIVLEDPLQNKKEILLEYAEKWKASQNL